MTNDLIKEVTPYFNKFKYLKMDQIKYIEINDYLYKIKKCMNYNNGRSMYCIEKFDIYKSPNYERTFARNKDMK
jgi:hypothetical protein